MKYCRACGAELRDTARFCAVCGTPTAPPSDVPPPPKKKKKKWPLVLGLSLAAVVVICAVLLLVLNQPNEKSGALAYYEGEWYGWWVISDATGDWVVMDGYWWDCCAAISSVGRDTAALTVWDETYDRADPLAELHFTPEAGNLLTDGSGYFLNASVSGLTVDPGYYDSSIALTGTYTDPAGNGSFTYTFLLRPWGETWDDVAAHDVPLYYETWYLPLIEAGQSAPDQVGE